MKHLQKYSSLILILAVIISYSFLPVNNCTFLHEGTFLYNGVDENDIVVKIKGNKHLELHNGGKYKIESKLEWLNDCEYNMTMTKITIPDFPYGPGDVMNVKVNKVEDSLIYYTATVKDKSWEGILKKIK